MADSIALSGQSIFLTGGTGFVGRTLLDYAGESARLHGDDFEICVLSRNPEAFLAAYPEHAAARWLTFQRGDILALTASGRRFSAVLHAAADTHANASARDWMRQIIDGTAAALEFACGSGATRFLHTSSGAVYGPQPAGVAELEEDFNGAPSTSHPGSAYGQAKRVAEQLCTAYHIERGLATLNARCFAFVGRHLPLEGQYAIGNFIRDALRADRIFVRGDGTAVRSYLDGRELAHWLVSLLLYGPAGHAVNVGSSRPVSVLQLAQLVAAEVAPGKPVEVQRRELDTGLRSVYVPSVRKAESLGLRQEIDLASSIRVAAARLSGGRAAQ